MIYKFFTQHLDLELSQILQCQYIQNLRHDGTPPSIFHISTDCTIIHRLDNFYPHSHISLNTIPNLFDVLNVIQIGGNEK
jgi:hypothetical protein